ncbi:MAG TPA: hypothetical protein P5181_15615 [Dermatophilaceae bacterium]|nr:hypothetical protein [Dermatophilaceae bacterium]
MRGLLIGLFPRSWRREHGASYRSLLDSAPLTPSVVAGVVRAARSARAASPLGLALRPWSWSAVATALSLVLLFLFFGGWSDIYRERDIDLEWRLVQLAALGYAAIGGWLLALGHRVAGAGTVLAAVTAIVWQLGVGVPGWRVTPLPLSVALVWFMALSCFLAWRAVGGRRGIAELTGAA